MRVNTKLLALLLLSATSCNVQKRIAEASQQAVKMDRLENPCANDSVYITTQGATITNIDTMYSHTHTSDTANYYRTDTITVTKTRTRIDTMVIAITDQYLVNAWKDSVNVHKRFTARLQGNNDELKQTIKQDGSRIMKLLVWLVLTWLLIVAGIVILIKIKVL
jgi:hypothetical protein